MSRKKTTDDDRIKSSMSWKFVRLRKAGRKSLKGIVKYTSNLLRGTMLKNGRLWVESMHSDHSCNSIPSYNVATMRSQTKQESRLLYLCPHPQSNPSVSEQRIDGTHHLQPKVPPQLQRKKTSSSSTTQSSRHERPGTVKDPG